MRVGERIAGRISRHDVTHFGNCDHLKNSDRGGQSLSFVRPEIFNTDQGSQFTSREFTGALMSQDIAINMDGKGRAIDNVMIERLWRTVKYEEVYLKEYATGTDCKKGLASYFDYYGHERRHQSLDRQTPWAVYRPTCSKRTIHSI